jgi:putrescine transport system permease protein
MTVPAITADDNTAAPAQAPLWRKLVVRVPYAWLVVFFLIPFLIVLKISLSQTALAQPPYLPVLDLAAGWSGLVAFFTGLSFDNYRLLASDPLYVLSYVKSVEIAAFSTLILLVIGYPLAYAIARTPPRWQAALVLLTILPFWTSLLIRIYAWMNILQHDGLLNQALMTLRIVREPPVWLSTETAVYIGMVYSYLPFMVLPLYASLEKMDQALIEAAADLGCPRWKIFWLITLPLSSAGMVAGVLLCFIPIVGEFVIPDLLGSSDSPMIGQTIWMEFFGNKDWPAASAVAVVLLCVLVTPIAVYQSQAMRAAAGE